MIDNGATTLWERWEYLDDRGMNSHSHHMIGSIGSFFYRIIAGIRPDPEKPGYKNIIIKPYPIGNLKHAEARIATIYGIIVSKWKRDDRKFHIDIDIPPNTTADLYMPIKGFEKFRIEESGKELEKNDENIRIVSDHSELDKFMRFKISSGNYSFALISI
jgi:alpha-L-rhamnosidase